MRKAGRWSVLKAKDMVSGVGDKKPPKRNEDPIEGKKEERNKGFESLKLKLKPMFVKLKPWRKWS